MNRRSLLLSSGALLLASGCLPQRSNNLAQGKRVTSLIAYKNDRKLYVMSGSEILATYRFKLGFAPVGHKSVRGDGKTPEGLYYIDRKNPNSDFHLSLGISYPNAADKRRASARGEDPGDDIFIHGTPRKYRWSDDWTWGCIAVKNWEMEELFAVVDVGTPIMIHP